jgi:hypothetical protein
MGDVISLIRQTCVCGWKPPRRTHIEFDGFVADVVIKYECPECGRWLEPAKIEEKI